MSSGEDYAGRHAALYDLFYADKPYAAEAAFVASELTAHARRPVRRVLELACGTGRHAAALVERGFDVTATDASESMLARARERLGPARVRHADMRRIDLGEPFDGVVCLFDSLGYVLTNEALAETLRGIAAHLAPGGAFVFEFWHAAAMLRGYEPTRVRRFANEGRPIVRISETTVDAAAQTCAVTYTVYEHDAAGRVASSFTETQRNRFFLVQEMTAFLTAAGLEPCAFRDGFADGPVSLDTWHVVATARRPS